jgi:signal transduction histidine kinase
MHVLLIEDNPDAAVLVQEYLASATAFPCQLTHVGDLGSALAWRGPDKFDVILLDLSLPDAQGLDTVRRMHAARGNVPIVVLTGLDDEKAGLDAVREGAQDYLVKGDLSGRALVRALRYALERQRAQEELRQSEERLRQAQKMETVGRLAGGVAHDINNMMTVVTGFSDLVLGRLGAEEGDLREAVEQIRLAGERAAMVTRQLLAFGRKQILQPVVLDLNAVVSGMERMLRSLIREDIELATFLDPALLPVKADPGQVEVVLLNLVVNARDAMPGGGKLTVETGNRVLIVSDWADDFEGPPGAHALLAVSDNGCGMDEETRSHLFEPFFTTKEVGKGTGLGLATVYGIVKQSGGHIAVYSEVGHGTTFKVYLPQVTEQVPCALPRPHCVENARGTETVLLVEDDACVRRLAREVLRADGYTVLEAGNGKEALRIGERYAGPIHLLLTDTIMPEMNGRELSERLLTLRPEMNVLYVSGYAEDVIAHHGVLDPGIAFLPKPLTPAALLRKMREVLDQVKPAACDTT